MKCIPALVVYISNYSWRIYLLQRLHEGTSPNSLTMLEALLSFEGRSLILAQTIRQGKDFFCILVSCTCSAEYLANLIMYRNAHEKKNDEFTPNLYFNHVFTRLNFTLNFCMHQSMQHIKKKEV